MVPIVSLWLPILLSAVIVFVLSSIIHMMLGYHRNDFRRLAAEDGVMDALRPFDLKPGNYMFPCPPAGAGMRDPGYKEKYNRGPVGLLTVMPAGVFNMTGRLVQWFVYTLAVGVVAAYVTGRALGPGAHYLLVFRFAGCTAFVAYAGALFQDSIWYNRSWGATLRTALDGLIYALFTAGTFGWLWPR